MRDMLHWRLIESPSVTECGVTATPLTRLAALRWPGGTLLWARPAGVIIQQGSSRRQVSILDLTRLFQLVILGVGASWLVARAARQRRERHA
jgi:hypothetical protein